MDPIKGTASIRGLGVVAIDLRVAEDRLPDDTVIGVAAPLVAGQAWYFGAFSDGQVRLGIQSDDTPEGTREFVQSGDAAGEIYADIRSLEPERVVRAMAHFYGQAEAIVSPPLPN